MSDRLERLASVVLAVCAVMITGAVMYRVFGAPTPSSAAQRTSRPVSADDWRQALDIGIRVGNGAAPVKIVEFTDLECPACRAFHVVAREVLRERPDVVSLVVVHFPLRSHRFALAAARAAECADASGAFAQFVDAVFAKQDSLGRKPWVSYATDAGIADTTEFHSCASASAPVERIQRGHALGESIAIAVTPTIVVNGQRFDGLVSKRDLDRHIDSIISRMDSRRF